jgi:hypothetical protein
MANKRNPLRGDHPASAYRHNYIMRPAKNDGAFKPSTHYHKAHGAQRDMAPMHRVLVSPVLDHL